MQRGLALAVLVVLGCGRAAQALDPLFLVGTVTNTTNQKQPLTADALITFDSQGACVVRIGKPLYGSGPCSITAYDKGSDILQLQSNGPLTKITWDGAVGEDGRFVGIYSVQYPSLPSLPEGGTFSFSIRATGDKVLSVADVLKSDTITINGEEYLLWLDGNLLSVHHKDGSYAGLRVLLDDASKPLFIVQDRANGSTYLDAASQRPVLEWVINGESGYFQKTVGGLTSYYDRFSQPTGWSSVTVGSNLVFIREDATGAELYDATLKPLGARLSKTTDGNLFWAVDRGQGVTEFFDGEFRPLHWYSLQANGQTYYAFEEGKKFRLYDASLRPLKRQRPSFWSHLALGVAVGLVAYGQAMQAWEAQQPQASGVSPSGYNSLPARSTTMLSPPGSGLSFSTTSTNAGDSYQTTSQRLGNFTFSHTTGSNGYQAHSTTQSIGTFDYTYGASTLGSFSGTGQRIGNFDFVHLMTGAGNWSGTGQRLGTFTFYNFNGPGGQNVSATSQRIGNFIFTNTR